MLDFIAWLKKVFSKGKVEEILNDDERYTINFLYMLSAKNFSAKSLCANEKYLVGKIYVINID